MSITTGYEAFVMAMERVERRLKQVTAALDAARTPPHPPLDGHPEDANIAF